MSLLNSRLVTVGVAGIIAVGVIGFGSVAMAQSGEEGSPSGEHSPKHRLGQGLKNLLEGAGLTREEIKDGATAGLTLGEIIDQSGDISQAEAKANALTALETALAEAVANGRITQEKADEIFAAAPARIDQALATVPGSNLGDRPNKGRFVAIGKHALETVAGVLGIEVSELGQQLKDGATVAEIAGDDTQAVIDALVAETNEAIDNAVADGKLTAEQGEKAKSAATERITKWVNEGRPERSEGANLRERIREHRQR